MVWFIVHSRFSVVSLPNLCTFYSRIWMLKSRKTQTLTYSYRRSLGTFQPWNYCRRLDAFQPMSPRCLSVTDGQTDDLLWQYRALRSIAHRRNWGKGTMPLKMPKVALSPYVKYSKLGHMTYFRLHLLNTQWIPYNNTTERSAPYNS